MTREEAIEYLKRADVTVGREIKTKTAKALEMAIKALEQEPTTKNDLGVDCISREQAKEAIRDKFKNLPSRVEINTILNELPSVTPQEPRWIPVSERVAEFPCLACDIFGQIFIPFTVVTLNNRCFDGKEFDFDVEKFLKGKEVTLFSGEKVYEPPKEIVAWMPLPEPYKEVRDKE